MVGIKQANEKLLVLGHFFHVCYILSKNKCVINLTNLIVSRGPCFFIGTARQRQDKDPWKPGCNRGICNV